jgi:hypothetical protein
MNLLRWILAIYFMALSLMPCEDVSHPLNSGNKRISLSISEIILPIKEIFVRHCVLAAVARLQFQHLKWMLYWKFRSRFLLIFQRKSYFTKTILPIRYTILSGNLLKFNFIDFRK